jgi:tRNA threonylcarbamoyladenosine biosynthesis protein TsaE
MPELIRQSIPLPNLTATQALGRWLGQRLFAGAVVALVGPLGAGKTHLARAIAVGLGVTDERLVTSPTFVLLQEYQGRLPVYHFDVYRLGSERAFVDLGTDEYLEGEGVCLIEWADRVARVLPAEHLWIELSLTGPESRLAVIEGRGQRYAEWLRKQDPPELAGGSVETA